MKNQHQIQIMINAYVYFAIEKNTYDWLIKNRSRLHINCALEERKIEDTLFDSVRGNGSIKRGVVKKKKLKWLI